MQISQMSVVFATTLLLLHCSNSYINPDMYRYVQNSRYRSSHVLLRNRFSQAADVFKQLSCNRIGAEPHEQHAKMRDFFEKRNKENDKSSRHPKSDPETMARLTSASVLRNLMAFNSLSSLLEALELFVGCPDTGLVTAQQAVAALNHLKRLSKQASEGESARVEVCMRWFSTVAARGMRRLSGKHVALALNAIRGYLRTGQNNVLESSDPCYVELFQAGIVRLKQLALLSKSGTELDSSSLLDAQNIANIVNALAAVRFKDRQLFSILSEISLQRSAADFGPQAIANILNGFARAEMWDQRLWRHMATAALVLDPASFSAQHIANIVNACHKAGFYEVELFRHMSAAAQSLPATAFSAQARARLDSAAVLCGGQACSGPRVSSHRMQSHVQILHGRQLQTHLTLLLAAHGGAWPKSSHLPAERWWRDGESWMPGSAD